MKKFRSAMPGFLVFLSVSVFSQNPVLFNLHQLVSDKGMEVFNRELSLVDEKGYPGIRLSKDFGEGVAWLKGIAFSNGTIEFDVRGENVKQRSFVGFAFHGRDNETFDAIYLRPFQFMEQDEVLRSHGIQYISLPDFTWRTLREKFPGKYEHAVYPAPDPNYWVRVRIVIKESLVSVYINGNSQPSLTVEKVTGIKTGSIGFYVADISGGDFANLTITKTE